MKVTIVIPAYNAATTIKRAVDSALNQNFTKKDFEIIVINDGSTDETLKILKFYGRQIKIINQKKNKGFLKTANRGFKKAKGKYLIKLDADDCFEPTILKEIVAVLDKKPKIDFVYCDYYEKSSQGRIKIVSTKDNIFNTIGIGILFRRDKFKKERFFNKNVRFAEYDLLLKTEGSLKGYHISKPLFYYNRRKRSITKNKNWVKGAIAQLKKLYPKKLEKIKKIRKY